MVKTYEDTGVGISLTERERKRFIDIILSVYPSKSRFKRCLYNMPDQQLMAFSNNLTSSGKALATPSIVYIRYIMSQGNADTYVLDSKKDGYVFYLGETFTNNRFHRKEVWQVGSVETSSTWSIRKVVIGNKEYKRFGGMKLRIDELNSV
jgi:hypothetical protein